MRVRISLQNTALPVELVGSYPELEIRICVCAVKSRLLRYLKN